jgi:uncharacterized NAD-dependent epimerase/dehydratase family protein
VVRGYVQAWHTGRVLELRAPYLVFFGDEERPTYAKTGLGLAQWRPELCMGQFRLTPDTADAGLPDHNIVSAAAEGAQSVIIGTALIGGSLPTHWIPALVQALELGLDVVAGFHTRLTSFPELVEAAQSGGGALIDVRVPPDNIPVGTGIKRPGKRLLTVGTDCALGKKYTALAIEKEMRERGMKATFRASGQTGIMISGSGIPMDAVVADFLTGAAEMLSPRNDDDHWDVIEGQGALHHPGYAPVSMGLLLGSQPDAFVVCTEAGRTRISGWDNFPLPDISEVIERTIEIGFSVNPRIKPVGISVNTSSLSDEEAQRYLRNLSHTYELPAVDPLRGGVGPIIDYLSEQG